MFDLEREVAAWSASANAEPCRRDASVAELADHLHCEIDRARAAGMSDEQAFAAAVAKLGSATKLAAEHTKNRSALGAACAVAARIDRHDAGGGHRGLLLAHACLWASLMLGSSLMMSRSAAPGALAWLLLGILVPGWWSSELLLRRALQHRGRDGAR